MLYIIGEYVRQSYVTLMLLLSLSVILIANRKVKIEGTQYIWSILGLVFFLSICEYVEYLCDKHDWNIWILYLKTSLIYCIYPLIALVELYLIAPLKHKAIVALPYFLNIALIMVNLSGVRLLFWYSENRVFRAAMLYPYPTSLACVYVLLIAWYSIGFMKEGKSAEALIVTFMVISTLVTALLDMADIVVEFTDEITVVEIMIYYFYLAAIRHSDVISELHKRELELQESKLNLMMAQIKPHFINNAMVAVQELCIEDPKKASETVGHFSRYLQNNIAAIGSSTIHFMHEIDAVKEYLAVEYADVEKKFRVEYDLKCTDFMLPVLTVQPLVENAVKHGIDKYSEDSVIRIATEEDDENITIRIEDNGKGFKVNAETFGKGGIGLENSKKRLAMMCGGTLETISGDEGTFITIKLPKNYGR